MTFIMIVIVLFITYELLCSDEQFISIQKAVDGSLELFFWAIVYLSVLVTVGGRKENKTGE